MKKYLTAVIVVVFVCCTHNLQASGFLGEKFVFTSVLSENDTSSLMVPNVFSPNRDGINDIFQIDGTNLISIEAEVFNRFGQRIYSWNGLFSGWDGRTTTGEEVAEGTYFFIIRAEGLDGASYMEKGTISLVR